MPADAVEPRNALRQSADAEIAQVLEEAILVGDELAHTRKFRDRFRIARCITAHDDNGRRRISLMQTADELPAFGIALGGDGAGVDDAKLGGFVRGGRAPAVQFERLLDVLRLVLVDLATEGDEPA